MSHRVPALAMLVLLAACRPDSNTPTALPTQTQVAAPQLSTVASGALSIATADNAICRINPDHTLSCSGSFPGAAPTGNDYVQVAMGAAATTVCALKSDGNVECWGSISGTPAGPFTQVAVTNTAACALRPDATVVCWGANTYGQATPPAGVTFTDLQGGALHFCGVASDQTVRCWGVDLVNQADPPAGTFSQVWVSSNSSCGVHTDGTIECWGLFYRQTPRPLAGTYVRVVSSDNYACGQRSDGTASCWGSLSAFPITSLVPGGAISPMVGSYQHVCGMYSGQFACWGYVGTISGIFGVTDAPQVVLQSNRTVDEGTLFTLAAQATDPNGDPLTYEWDINNDYATDSTGASVTLGPITSDRTVTATISDGYSRITQRFNATYRNLPPTGTFVAPATVAPGATFTLALSNVSDPGADSVTMRASFGCGGTLGAPLPHGTYQATCTAPSTPTTLTVRARISDFAGSSPAARIYTASVVVASNAPPTATLSAPASVAEGTPIQLSLTNIVDENVPALQYAFDCGSGYGAYGSSSSTASCPTTDDGTRTVRAKLKDDGGLETEYTSAVTITDVPPVVNPFNGATIMAGETYSASGSFSGAAVDAFTGSVNYGDGVQPLTLNGWSFALSHTYATAGTYNVTVIVTDDDGSTSSSSASVVVQSAAQAAQTLTSTITALVSSGVLSSGTANAMTSTISNAAASYSSGNVTAGNNKMNAFINQVQAQLNSGRLTSAQGQALIDYANRVIASANG